MYSLSILLFWSMALSIYGLVFSDRMEKVAAEEGKKEAPADGRALFQAMVSRFQEVRDYKCLFLKRERIGDRWDQQKMNLWFRKPMDIKLYWLEPFAGRQALYRHGFNENRIRARHSGLLGLFPIDVDPLGKLAMENNRYPITHAGIGTILDETAADMDLGRFELQIVGEVLEEDRPCFRLRFRSLGPAGFHHSRVTEYWMDKQMQLPIRLQVYDGEDGLVGDYAFRRLEINIGLTDKDFEI